jgi:hypothetical protein
MRRTLEFYAKDSESYAKDSESYAKDSRVPSKRRLDLSQKLVPGS